MITLNESNFVFGTIFLKLIFITISFLLNKGVITIEPRKGFFFLINY